MAIRMIGLDLDGTTLDNNGRFSDRTKEAFRRAKEKGAHIIVATGRALCSLPAELYEIEGLDYVVTSNGARIIKTCNRETVYEDFVDEGAVRVVHDILLKRNAMIEIFYNGRAYIGEEEFNRIVNGGNTRRSRNYVSSTRTPVKDIYSLLLQEASQIENISINYFDEEEKRETEKVLAEIENITLTSSFTYNNEIGGKETSKAKALRFLMDMLEVTEEELMCCGDSPNDLQMIELSKIGVAMGNALDLVKDRADYVTDTNHNDGVAKAIEKFVL